MQFHLTLSVVLIGSPVGAAATGVDAAILNTWNKDQITPPCKSELSDGAVMALIVLTPSSFP